MQSSHSGERIIWFMPFDANGSYRTSAMEVKRVNFIVAPPTAVGGLVIITNTTRRHFLFYHAACYSPTASTQSCWHIGIGIAAGMDHERTARQIGSLESRGENRSGSLTISTDE